MKTPWFSHPLAVPGAAHELRAYDEGLFAREGIKIEWATATSGVKATESGGRARRASTVRPAWHSSGAGKAECTTREWGNTAAPGHRDRQPPDRPARNRPHTRRVVRPDSPVYNAQPIAGRTVWCRSCRHHYVAACISSAAACRAR